MTTMPRGWQVYLWVCCSMIVLTVGIATAQSDTATISGRIDDPAGAAVVGARVALVDIDRGTEAMAETNKVGLYTFQNIRPGHYRMQVSASNFRTVNVTGLTVNIQDSIQQNFKLALGSISESVTVVAAATSMELSGTVGTVIDQRIIKDAPLNGRSFQTLFQLTPGVVIAPTFGGSQGQFSANGQRTNSNYFTIDGASANAGQGAGGNPGQNLGGSVPPLSTSGGTNSLVSIDAVQEFAIQTSTFAPEFGRMPGAQVSIVTKSGTNEFHGDLFDYLRNDLFDANDWFANHNGVKRPELRQNDFGGVFGGPVYKNDTFFFFSYEGLRLRQPTTATTDVPTLAARSAAPAGMKPLFNAYPLPTGPDEFSPCDPASDPSCPPSGQKANGLAPAIYSFSNPSALDAASLRIDHRIGHSITAFARYNYSPSSASNRAISASGVALSDVSELNFALQTLTLGLTHSVTSHMANDIRFNWTRFTAGNKFVMDNFGGAVPLTPQEVFQAGFTTNNSVFFAGLSFAARFGSIFLGRNAQNEQRQINVVDNASWQKGAHLLKFGVDYRRLTPFFDPLVYEVGVLFSNINSALASTPAVAVTASEAPARAKYQNYSLYGQDTWNPVRRLTFTYGLRWDYHPAPSGGGLGGLQPVIIHNITDPSNLSPAPASELFRTNRDNFGPRFGFAYALRDVPGNETLLRGGLGMFYDLGTGAAGFAFSNAPYLNVNVFFPNNYPLTSAESAPPPLPAVAPYSLVVGFPDTLKTPYTYHWNLSVQQALGNSQSITASYVGAASHSLERIDEFVAGLSANVSGEAWFINPGGYSNYNSFQAQYRRRTTHGLDVLASYTLAHSLDNGSSEADLSIPGQFINPRTEYGPSTFDIRHTRSMALTYEIPRATNTRIFGALLNGWGISSVFTSRSGPPVNVTINRNLGFGSYDFRPDLVTSAPLYLNDPTLPGGRSINPAALAVQASSRQGTLSRNFFRGFSLVQFDVGVQRRFRVTERIHVNMRLEGFNILNHPNFSSPDSQFGTVDSSGTFTPTTGFGMSSSMLNQGLSSGSGFGAGFNPLYQIGGPRSLQIAMKLEF